MKIHTPTISTGDPDALGAAVRSFRDIREAERAEISRINKAAWHKAHDLVVKRRILNKLVEEIGIDAAIARLKEAQHPITSPS